MSNVAIIEPRQKSVLLDMSDRYGMEPVAFEATLRATVVPKDCSKEQFAAFLLVAKEYKLNPLLKEIYAFPAKGGGIQPIVGVDGWANLINSHPAFDGMDFEDHLNEAGEIQSITCRMYRKDRTRPITATEYLAECKRPTDPWTKWPRRMLRHKAMIQAARYAFSFAGIVDPDEAERFAGDTARDVTPRAPLVDRLAAAKAVTAPAAAGFSINHVETEVQRDSALTDSMTSPTAPMASEREPEASGSEWAHDRSESAPSPDSNSPQPPSVADEPAAPNPAPQPPDAAGNLSNPSDQPAPADGASGEDGTGHASPSSLPQGWAIQYAAALRRAQKKESLAKYAAAFWDQNGGWAKHKDGPDGATAVAIFDAFRENFGDKDVIEAQLREII